MNKCIDCGEPVGLRRKRCDEHRRAHRAKLERDRVARNKIEEPEDYEPEYSGEVIEARPGHRNPVEIMRRAVRRPEQPEPDVIDYTQRGQQQRPSIYQRPEQRTVRRTQGGVDMTGNQLRAQAAAKSGREEIDWANLPEVADAYEYHQDRPLSAWRSPGDSAGPRCDSLGLLVARNRRRERNGLR